MRPKFFGQLVQPVFKEVVDRAKGPVVLHVCGNSDGVIEMMCDTGVAGISIEEKANMKAAVEIAHAKGVKVFGNVATATTLFSGTPEEVYKEAIRGPGKRDGFHMSRMRDCTAVPFGEPSSDQEGERRLLQIEGNTPKVTSLIDVAFFVQLLPLSAV